MVMYKIDRRGGAEGQKSFSRTDPNSYVILDISWKMQSLVHSVRALSLQSVQLKPVILQQQHQLPCIVQVVHMSFFKSETADTLWKTMTGVSQQGKKRGRARNLLRPKNLNRGQMYGFGKKRIDFPGLSSKVLSGSGADVKTKNIEEMR